MTLTFDPRAHEYRWGSRVLPSVTGVLKGAGYYDHLNKIPRRTLERARRRGDRVHQVIDGYIRQGRALGHPDIEVDHCLREFGRAVQVIGLKPIDSELRLVDAERQCAGTLDILAKVYGSDWAVVDVKVMEEVNIEGLELQTAKYAAMAEEEHEIRVHHRIGLQLYPGKPFELHPLRDPLARVSFEGLLRAHLDRERQAGA